jgi:hypothetical protein
MKGNLSFDLNDPDEKLAFKKASTADDAYGAHVSFAEEIRAKVKWGKPPKTWQEVSDLFYDALEEHGIDIDEFR